MPTLTSPDRSRTPLAAAIASLFALGAPAVGATTFVTNCYDAGPGSLRAAVSAAISGDTVDASALTTASPGCSRSTISLKTGAIAVNRLDLTIVGPGTNFAVSAKYDNGSGFVHQYQNRLFTHTPAGGTLRLKNLSLLFGYQTGTDAMGGCVYSKGNVILEHVNVAFCNALCTASGTGAEARGGAVYTNGNLTLLKNSTLSFNSADGGSFGLASGGGAAIHGNFTSQDSSINSNYTTGYGGGIDVWGLLTSVRDTTIAGNHAKTSVGGLRARGGTYKVEFQNSTVSGNRADTTFGGLYADGHIIHLYNSTIAFNTAGTSSPGVGLRGPNVVLQSTLIANNTYGAAAASYDLGAASAFITGADNLVRTSVASLPADTIVGKCPLLAPLKMNGGLTLTHALLGHSPAIDAGNNSLGLAFDQRAGVEVNGVRDYPRVSGPPGGSAFADIGAFEVDRAEKVFDANFEGCP